MRFTRQSMTTLASSASGASRATGGAFTTFGALSGMSMFIGRSPTLFPSVFLRAPDDDLRRHVQDQDQAHEHERRRPRELREMREGAARKVVDEHGERSDRRAELAVEPVVAEEGREEQ